MGEVRRGCSLRLVWTVPASTTPGASPLSTGRETQHLLSCTRTHRTVCAAVCLEETQRETTDYFVLPHFLQQQVKQEIMHASLVAVTLIPFWYLVYLVKVGVFPFVRPSFRQTETTTLHLWKVHDVFRANRVSKLGLSSLARERTRTKGRHGTCKFIV